MTERTKQALADGLAILAIAAMVFAMLAIIAVGASPNDGAGPALLEALDGGWRPDLAPRHPPACDTMCGGAACCTKCSKASDCCCIHAPGHCSCGKDPTRGTR